MDTGAPQRSTPGDRGALLLALRLGGAADPDALAARTGWNPDEVLTALDAAASDAQVRAAAAGTWVILPEGRAVGEQLLAEALQRSGATAVVRGAYAALLEVNHRLLEVCTDWQLRTVDGALVVNDHLDAAHDAGVIAGLDAVHGSLAPALEGLEAVTGFGSYAPRLRNALARVHAGEVDYLTKPTIDSYHQVWFELHEHLLAALGIERSTEGQAR